MGDTCVCRGGEVSICHLRLDNEWIANVKIKNGLIYQYSEVADTFPALQRLGFTSDRIGKMASKAASRLESRHELSGHL